MLSLMEQIFTEGLKILAGTWITRDFAWRLCGVGEISCRSRCVGDIIVAS
jgi:hypothetical protein